MMKKPNVNTTFQIAFLFLGTLAIWQTISIKKELYKSLLSVPNVLNDTTLKRTPAPNVTLNQLHCPVPTFSKRKLPITALASFPGSGNTWMRHLIQAMTGILTGAVYSDKYLMKHGFPGEGKTDGSVIVVKTHKEDRTKFKRCVLLMRNPYEAFLADCHRRLTTHHTGYAKLDKFSKKWNSYFTWYLQWYSDLFQSWLKHENVHLVMFDNLVGDLKGELTRLLKFLQNSTCVVGNVQCALGNPTGGHKRDHSKSVPIEFFYSKEKMIKVNTMIDRLHALFSKRFNKQVDVMKTWKLPLTKGK